MPGGGEDCFDPREFLDCRVSRRLVRSAVRGLCRQVEPLCATRCGSSSESSSSSSSTCSSSSSSSSSSKDSDSDSAVGIAGNGAYVGRLGVVAALYAAGETSLSSAACNALHASLEPPGQGSKKRLCTFLDSDSNGLALHAWAVAGIVPTADGLTANDHAISFLRRARCALESGACGSGNGGSDELLYGLAGLLHGCLVVLSGCEKNGGETHVDGGDPYRGVARVAGDTLRRLVESAGQPPWRWPWHGKVYLGAVHGSAGVIAQIAQSLRFPSVVEASGIDRSRLEAGIAATARWILIQRVEGGTPSSERSTRRVPLCQVCHGDPGVLVALAACCEHVPAMAHGDGGVLRAAMENMARGIADRGALRKGPGLCHGIAGNALALLCYARFLGGRKKESGGVDAEWCRGVAEGMIGFAFSAPYTRVPDRPRSLFEGTAGLVYAWALMERERRGGGGVAFPGIDVGQ